MQALIREVRHALRSLAKQPVFAIVATLTLALGIGATTALFTIVNAVLLRPLSYDEPDRLISISDALDGRDRTVTTEPNMVAWRRSAHSLLQLSGYGGTSAVLTGAGDPASIRGAVSNAALFSVLRVAPAVGRVYRADEERGTANRVVVLSHRLWQTRFHADSRVIDTTITLDGVAYTVLGVMPSSFDFPRGADYWRPRAFDAATPNIVLYGSVIARLAPGVTIASAREELARLSDEAKSALPAAARAGTVVVKTLHDRQVGDSRQALLLLFGAVAALLLIGCANVANLTLTRATQRRREFAVRVALGASRWRLARQLLVESLIVSIAGAAVGLVIPVWSIDAVVRLSPASVANMTDIHVNATVLLFATGAALVTGIVFALVPMALSFRRDLSTPLGEGGGRSGSAGRRDRLQGGLVIAEIAIALALVTGGGLLTRSLTQVLATEIGFQPSRLLAADVFLRRSRYPDAAQATRFFEQVAEQVRAIPGVESVGVTDALPLRGFAMTASLRRPGDGASVPDIAFTTVSRDYFPTLRAAPVEGRIFDATDSAGSPRSAVLNATAAKRLFPSGNAVGSILTMSPNDTSPATVIGIVKDMPQRGLESTPGAQLYLSLDQDAAYPYSVLVRTSGNPIAIERAVRDAVLRVDSLQPVDRIVTMDDVVGESVAPRRFNSLLIDIFAGLALFLASVGLYGVMSSQVANRTRELGVRMALGADARSVLTLVLRRGVVLAGAGIGSGLMLALLLTRVLTGLLYQVSPRDPVTFISAPLLLLAVTAIACLVPGRRATQVDPVVALRD